MNISSCDLLVLNKPCFIKQQQNSAQAVQNPISLSFVQPSIQNYQAYILSFQGAFDKKVDYANREEYIEYMDKRIKDTVHNRSEEEIAIMIDEIAKENDVGIKQVQEVMARVVQFTSYAQLPHIYTGMKKLGANRFSIPYAPNYADLNNVLHYIGRRKHQIVDFEYEENGKRVEGLLLDDRTIAHIRDLSNSEETSVKKKDFNNYLEGLNNGSIKFFLIDGWNTKIDDKDMSYTAFGAKYDLKTVVSSIVKEQKKTGKSLDEIMNGDIINQVKDIFGEDIEIGIIKNYSADNPNTETITKLLHHNAPDKEYIRALFKVIETTQLNNQEYTKNGKDFWLEILSEYYDKALCIYSPETLNEEMKTMYYGIEKKVHNLRKTMDDVIYLIPSMHKSFEAINYQYAKVNNVPSEQFIFHDGTGLLKQTDYGTVDFTGKVAVVLDDFAGSGDSLSLSEFRINDFNKRNKETPLIIATICSLTDASEKIKEEMKRIDNKAYFLTNKEFDFYDDFYYKLPSKKAIFITDENMISGRSLFRPNGYKNGAACVSFPYMLPDNNKRISNILLNCTNNKSFNNHTNNSKDIINLIETEMKK